MPSKRPRSEAERRFYAAWRTLSKVGKCDVVNSVEYWRVLREWRADGRPARVMSFICRHANVQIGGAP